MDSDGLTITAHTGADKAMGDLNLYSNSIDLGRKEMEAIERDVSKDIYCVDQGDMLELNDSQIVNTDENDTRQTDAASFNHEAWMTFTRDAEGVNQDVSDATFMSYDLLHQTTKSPESSKEEDTDNTSRELSDLTQSGESWEQMIYDSNTEEDDIKTSRKRSYSDLSTLRAVSTDQDGSNLSLANSDSFILDAEVIEPEVDADGKFLLSCDSLSSDIEFMETNDIGTDDFGLVPVDLPQVSLVSNTSKVMNEITVGPTAFPSLNFSITGADWHMASLPVKCLEMGAVNVASVTLGTVGISVIPMVSPGTIDINPYSNSIGIVPTGSADWETWSMDSISLATMSADFVNVDSITPEGIRERWHPLEDRLYALGEALTTLDKKLEGFSPRIQEAESLLNEVELSFSQHAAHISDIMKENNALAERVLQLEERLRGEKQQEHIWAKESGEET